MKQKFKLFLGYEADLNLMEQNMNTWAETLPNGAKIRRTQLAAANAGNDTFLKHDECDVRAPGFVVALINYEEDDTVCARCGHAMVHHIEGAQCKTAIDCACKVPT